VLRIQTPLPESYTTATPEALAERAVIAALHLLRQSLAATPTALR